MDLPIRKVGTRDARRSSNSCEYLKIVLTHLVEQRIVIDATKLAEPDLLFGNNLHDATRNIDTVIEAGA